MFITERMDCATTAFTFPCHTLTPFSHPSHSHTPLTSSLTLSHHSLTLSLYHTNQILRELNAVCQAQAPPPTNNPADLAKITMKPSAAAVLSILKPSGDDGGSNNKNPATTSKGGKKGAGSSSSSAKKQAAAAAARAAAAAAGGAAVAADGSSAAAALAAAREAQLSRGKSGDELAERLGVIRIEVYVWTTIGRLHK